MKTTILCLQQSKKTQAVGIQLRKMLRVIAGFTVSDHVDKGIFSHRAIRTVKPIAVKNNLKSNQAAKSLN